MGNCIPISYGFRTKFRKDINNTENKMEGSVKNLKLFHPEEAASTCTIDAVREFHNEESSTYWLPKDEYEQKRLTGQHFAIKELYEGNVLKSITDVLDLEKGVSIIDVGCGSGVWIMDMNHEFPNCSYVGSDIVKVVNKNLDIKQFTYEYGNIVKGLPYEDNTFDFLNMRLFVYALRAEEWPIAIKEAIRVVKPGGVLQFTEGEPKIPRDTTSAFYKLSSTLHAFSIAKGQDPLIAHKLEDLILVNENVRILESDPRVCNMNSKNPTGKKFAWDLLEGSKGLLELFGPSFGLNGKEELVKYLEELEHCLAYSNNYLNFNMVAVQKI